MKRFSIDMLVDEAMTRLFWLAEYVLTKTAGVRSSVECGSPAEEPAAPMAPVASVAPAAPAAPAAPSVAVPQSQQPLSPTIRFKHEDRMVEGELFG